LRPGLEHPEDRDLRLQLRDGAGGGRLIEDLLLRLLDLLPGRLVEVLEVVFVELQGPRPALRLAPPSLKDLLFPEPFLEPLPAPADRLENGLRRGRQAPLQDRQAKPTVPRRFSLSRASARLNCSRT